MLKTCLAKVFLQENDFWQKTILDLGIRRFGGYHAVDLVESFRMLSSWPLTLEISSILDDFRAPQGLGPPQ